jgi:hypothetical protein
VLFYPYNMYNVWSVNLWHINQDVCKVHSILKIESWKMNDEDSQSVRNENNILTQY